MLTICFFIDGVLSFNSVYSTNSSDGFSFLSLFIYFHKLADEIGSLSLFFSFKPSYPFFVTDIC